MNPTKEQIKEFWEWCGLRWFWNHNPGCNCGAVDNDDSARSWNYFDGKEWQRASNFWNEKMDDIERPEFIGYLFKYAVPKLDNCELSYDYNLSVEYLDKVTHSDFNYVASVRLDPYEDKHATAQDTDPTLALFWAIWEVIKES